MHYNTCYLLRVLGLGIDEDFKIRYTTRFMGHDTIHVHIVHRNCKNTAEIQAAVYDLGSLKTSSHMILMIHKLSQNILIHNFLSNLYEWYWQITDTLM